MECYVMCSEWSCFLAAIDRHLDALMALGAVIVAFFALRAANKQVEVTREQARLQRDHNYLSVMPNLIPHVERQVHQSMPGLPYEGMFRFRILNVGLGPATIHECHYYLDGKEFSTVDSREISSNVSAAIDLPLDRQRIHRFWKFGKIDGITQNSEVEWLHVSFQVPTIQAFRDTCDRIQSRLSAVIKYRSAYGQEAVLRTADFAINSPTTAS